MEDGIPGGLQHRHETCCEKDGRRGRWACRIQRWHHRGDVVFRTGGLVYDIYLIYYYPWSMLTTVYSTLNDHVYDMRPACVIHAV